MKNLFFQKSKEFLLIFFGIIFLNSYMMFELSRSFFPFNERIFLFILFNQIYFVGALIFIHIKIKTDRQQEEITELKYIISKVKNK